MDKLTSLRTSETSQTPQLTLDENMVMMVAASGKIRKKRRWDLNQLLTDDDLEAIANEVEEGKKSRANNVFVFHS